MPNILLTNQEITFEMLMVLKNELSFTKKVTREYDDKFGVAGAKIGYTLNIRKPARSVSTAGQGIQLQDYIERYVPLTLAKQYQQAFSFTSSDMALSIDDFSKRVIRPKVVQLANDVDYDGLQQFVNVYNEVGTPGTIPNSSDTYLAAAQKLQEEAVPLDDSWSVHISPAMNRTVFPSLQGLVSTSGYLRTLAKGGNEEYRKGLVGEGLGFEGWYMTQNAPSFTTGAYGTTTGLVNGSGQTGSTLAIDGFSASAPVLNAGDIITIAGIYAINPLTRQSTGALRQFVVTATTTGASNGFTALPIACVDGDGLVVAGPYATCSATTTDENVVTVQGAQSVTSSRGIAFHPEAFTFACADLPLYEGQHMCERIGDKDLGLSIRLWAQPDINTDRLLARMDLLGGWLTMYPQLACRIAS